MAKITPVEMILGGVAVAMVGKYLYDRYTKDNNPVPTPIPVYNAPLVLRSSGNTSQGVAPLLAVAANPQKFNPVTDAFSPNILF